MHGQHPLYLFDSHNIVCTNYLYWSFYWPFLGTDSLLGWLTTVVWLYIIATKCSYSYIKITHIWLQYFQNHAIINAVMSHIWGRFIFRYSRIRIQPQTNCYILQPSLFLANIYSSGWSLYLKNSSWCWYSWKWCLLYLYLE